MEGDDLVSGRIITSKIVTTIVAIFFGERLVWKRSEFPFAPFCASDLLKNSSKSRMQFLLQLSLRNSIDFDRFSKFEFVGILKCKSFFFFSCLNKHPTLLRIINVIISKKEILININNSFIKIDSS